MGVRDDRKVSAGACRWPGPARAWFLGGWVGRGGVQGGLTVWAWSDDQGVGAVGGDVAGWATVHGVRVPGGDLTAVWRLVTQRQERAERWADLLGGSAEPDGSGDWMVITNASALRVWITWVSGSTLGFRLLQAPGAGVIGLDLAPWTLAEVFGPNAAATMARWTLGDLGARVVIVKHRGGGFVRHLAPALSHLVRVA